MENSRKEQSKLRKTVYKSKVKRFSITSHHNTNNFNIYKSKNTINNNLKNATLSKDKNELKDKMDIAKYSTKTKKNFSKYYNNFIKILDGKEMISNEEPVHYAIKYLDNEKKTNIYLNPRNYMNTINIADKNLNQKKCKSNNKQIFSRFNYINKKISNNNVNRSDKYKSIQVYDNNTEKNKKIKYKRLEYKQRKNENQNLKNANSYNTINIINIDNMANLNTEKQENINKRTFCKFNNSILNNSLSNNQFKTIINYKKYHFNSHNKVKSENNQTSENIRKNKIKYINNDITFVNSFNSINKTLNNAYDENIYKYNNSAEKIKKLNSTENNFNQISNLNCKNYLKSVKLAKDQINKELGNSYIKSFTNYFEDPVNKSNQNNIRNRDTTENAKRVNNIHGNINLTKGFFNINVESLDSLNYQKTITKSERIDKKSLQLNRLDNQKLKNDILAKTFTSKTAKRLKKIYSKPLTHKLSLLYFSSNIIKADNSIININDRYSQKYPNESASNSIVIHNINNIKELFNNKRNKFSKRNITPKAVLKINSINKKKLLKYYSVKKINYKVRNTKHGFANKFYNYYIHKFYNIACYITKNNNSNLKNYGEIRDSIYFLPKIKLCYFSKNFVFKKNLKSNKIKNKDTPRIAIENDNNSNKRTGKKIKILDSQETKEELESNFEHKSDNISTIININNTYSLISNNDSLIKNETQDKINVKNKSKNIKSQEDLIPFSGDTYLFSLFKDDFLLESNSDKVVTEGKLISKKNIKIYDMEDLEKGLVILKNFLKKEISKLCFCYFKRYKNITDIKKIVENKKYNEIMRRNFVEFTLSNIGNYCRFTKDFVNKNSNIYLPIKNENNNKAKFITPTKKIPDNKKIFFSPHFKIIKNRIFVNSKDNYMNKVNFCTDIENNKEINNISIKVNYNYNVYSENDNKKKAVNSKSDIINNGNIYFHKKINEEKNNFSYEEIILYNQKNSNYCHCCNFLPKNIIKHCNDLQNCIVIKTSDEKSIEREILFLLNIITVDNFSLIIKEIIKVITLDINFQNIFLKLIINRITKEKIYIKVYAKCCNYLYKNKILEKKRFEFDNGNNFKSKIKSELLKKYNLTIEYLKDKNDIINFINFIIALVELNVLLFDSFFFYLNKLYKDYFKYNNKILLLESIISIINNISNYNINDNNKIKNIKDFFKDKIKPILKNTENFPSYLRYKCINTIEKYKNDYIFNHVLENNNENNYQDFLNNKQINEILYNIYINNDKEKYIIKLLIYDIQNYIKSREKSKDNYNWFIIDEIIFNLHVELNTIIFYYVCASQSIGASDTDIKYSNEYFNEILNYFLKYRLDNKYINKVIHGKIIDVFTEICSNNIDTINLKISYVFYSLLKMKIVKIDDFYYLSNKNEEIKKNLRNIINGVILLNKRNENHFLDSSYISGFNDLVKMIIN